MLRQRRVNAERNNLTKRTKTNEDEGEADRLSHQQREQQQQQQQYNEDDDDDDAGDDGKVQAHATRHRVNFEISPLSCAIHVRGVAKGGLKSFQFIVIAIEREEEGGYIIYSYSVIMIKRFVL